MIIYILIMTILAAIIFFIAAQFGGRARVYIMTSFVIISLFLFQFLIRNFDEPSEGSRYITREEIKSWNSK